MLKFHPTVRGTIDSTRVHLIDMIQHSILSGLGRILINRVPQINSLYDIYFVGIMSWILHATSTQLLSVLVEIL